jgi:hypothetical protein
MRADRGRHARPSADLQLLLLSDGERLRLVLLAASAAGPAARAIATVMPDNPGL